MKGKGQAANKPEKRDSQNKNDSKTKDKASNLNKNQDVIKQKKKLQKANQQLPIVKTDNARWQIKIDQKGMQELLQEVRTEKEMEKAKSLQKEQEKLKKAEQKKALQNKEQEERNQAQKKLEQKKNKKEISKQNFFLQIQSLTERFTSKYTRNLGGSFAQLRASLKVILFKNIFHGFYELNQLHQSQLKKSEKQITSLSTSSAYAMIRNLSTEIDLNVLKKFNKQGGSKSEREYTSFVKCLIQFIQDPSNFILRRKILTRQMAPSSFATMDEQELYSPEAKQMMNQKRNSIFRQYGAPFGNFQEEKYDGQGPFHEDKTKNDAKNSRKKFIQANYSWLKNTYQQVSFLLSSGFLMKICDNLKFPGMKNIERKLVSNFYETFAVEPSKK